MNRIATAAAVIALSGLVFTALPQRALGVSVKTGATIKAGTKIRCVLAAGADSRTLQVGEDFKLLIDDQMEPALTDAAIVGHITDVSGPHGLDRARIGFVFDYIQFQNKTKAPIHAIVLSKNVTQTNTAVAKQEAAKFSLPPMPVGTVTPGPVLFQIRFQPGSSPSITPPPVGQSSGYVYAQASNENIVVPPGTPVTIQLTNDLKTP